MLHTSSAQESDGATASCADKTPSRFSCFELNRRLHQPAGTAPRGAPGHGGSSTRGCKATDPPSHRSRQSKAPAHSCQLPADTKKCAQHQAVIASQRGTAETRRGPVSHVLHPTPDVPARPPRHARLRAPSGGVRDFTEPFSRIKALSA